MSITNEGPSLRNDTIETKPIEYRWEGERYGVEGGWEYTEAAQCEAGKCTHVSIGVGEDECPECGEYIYYGEGPMMNYYYPVKVDPTDAAMALADTCLCVVTVDGETGLALTGGGQDLSWEICAAFVAVGYLPPVHFAGKLPSMASGGKGPLGEKTGEVLLACFRSAEIAALWDCSAVETVRRRAVEYGWAEEIEGAAGQSRFMESALARAVFPIERDQFEGLKAGTLFTAEGWDVWLKVADRPDEHIEEYAARVGDGRLVHFSKIFDGETS